jgi:hypothetical protein
MYIPWSVAHSLHQINCSSQFWPPSTLCAKNVLSAGLHLGNDMMVLHTEKYQHIMECHPMEHLITSKRILVGMVLFVTGDCAAPEISVQKSTKHTTTDCHFCLISN